MFKELDPYLTIKNGENSQPLLIILGHKCDGMIKRWIESPLSRVSMCKTTEFLHNKGKM